MRPPAGTTVAAAAAADQPPPELTTTGRLAILPTWALKTSCDRDLNDAGRAGPPQSFAARHRHQAASDPAMRPIWRMRRPLARRPSAQAMPRDLLATCFA
jgi:hypothetical protein